MRGWVYIIINKAMPGLLKVGYTMKDPDLRAKELDHTGSPHPYIVAYEVLVEEPRQVEQTVHAQLSNFREGKEWFRCTFTEAVNEIRKVVGSGMLLETVRATLETTEIEAPASPTPPLEPQKRSPDQRTKQTPSFTRTSSLGGKCSYCGTYFTVTLNRGENKARCPECFRLNNASDLNPQTFTI